MSNVKVCSINRTARLTTQIAELGVKVKLVKLVNSRESENLSKAAVTVNLSMGFQVVP